MLKNTFCHLPGLNGAGERGLWAAGVHCWDDVRTAARLSRERADWLAGQVAVSAERLGRNDPHYFAGLLPAQQHWRLFPEFRHSVAYLDIETTGLGRDSVITTIALYDGRRVRCYVRGENLGDFGRDIEAYQLIVTYNGKAFDVPFIRRELGLEMGQAHLDLMYVLRALGYTGGLKGCERKLGLDRKELSEVDGYFAVLLWQEYQFSRNPKALETLLAYNVQDVVNLETLLVKAYNLNLRATPFSERLQLALPAAPALPFAADREIIERIKQKGQQGRRPAAYSV